MDLPASLTWIDHDPAARQRSLRILALFEQKESRDELGLGGIRDSFADQLFPGTSTIQTRLRYMLIVPWVYRSLEEKHVQAAEFGRRADQEERRLIEALHGLSQTEQGIFGGISGKSLKRLPSSVYWAGLASWGIFTQDLSQDQYHRRIGHVYRRREDAKTAKAQALSGDDLPEASPTTVTWHPRLPREPVGFPETLDMNLTAEEAGFIRDRIQRAHPRSLLAYLTLRPGPTEVATIWDHPDLGSFAPEHQELIAHGQIFSYVMHGAALVYNIALAERKLRDDLVAEHRESYRTWSESVNETALASWNLSRLWQLTFDHGHAITTRTMTFVETWVDIARRSRLTAPDDPAARHLVREREISLKGGKSRYTNPRALDQWSGKSGLGRLTYRWPNVRTFLEDLYAGLSREAE